MKPRVISCFAISILLSCVCSRCNLFQSMLDFVFMMFTALVILPNFVQSNPAISNSVISNLTMLDSCAVSR